MCVKQVDLFSVLFSVCKSFAVLCFRWSRYPRPGRPGWTGVRYVQVPAGRRGHGGGRPAQCGPGNPGAVGGFTRGCRCVHTTTLLHLNRVPLTMSSVTTSTRLQWAILFLPPATKLGQGYISQASVIQSRGGGVCSRWCLLPRGGVCSGGACGNPPQDSYCCGRYAFYWNAFLW